MATAKISRPRYHAPALEKGLDILELLADARLPLSQAELSQRLGRSQGEFFRMLLCLEERGYVIREAESGRFKLTLRLYELGHKQNAISMLRNAARVPMEELAEEIGQACHLSMQSGASALILMERMPSQRICLAVGEGTRFPLVDTTSGKLLLSQLSPEDVAILLKSEKAFCAKAVRQRKSILRDIQDLRESNYVVAKSSATDGVIDMATIVGVPGTDTLAALVVPYLGVARTRNESQEHHLKAIRLRAAQINRNLGLVSHS
jgi:DNA-binding IclR family transcriptional regulator